MNRAILVILGVMAALVVGVGILVVYLLPLAATMTAPHSHRKLPSTTVVAKVSCA